MTRMNWIVAAFGATALPPLPGLAQSPAVRFDASVRSEAFGYVSGVAGYTFTANSASSVTALGADFDVLGLSHTNFPITVTLWDDAGIIAAQASVPDTNPLNAHFRYASISPITLTAGVTYTIAAFYPQSIIFDNQFRGLTTSPQITLGSARFVYSRSLVEPMDNGYYFTNQPAFLGPNLLIVSPTAVPEPTPLPIAAGLLSCGLLLRRRR